MSLLPVRPEEVDFESFVEAARHDPVIGVGFLMGVRQYPIHATLQNHLTRFRNCYIEFPRGHGKTTQVLGRVAWETGRAAFVDRAVLRTKYIQQTDDEAKKSVRAIKGVMQSDAFALLFPGVTVDDANSGAKRITLNLTNSSGRVVRDAAIEASGIFGHAGGRFDQIVGDDVCDLQNAIQRPMLREQVKAAWANNWLPMADISAESEPRKWKLGTPYHVADITAEWRKFHASDGSLLRIPVVGMESPWGEVFTEAHMESIREEMGPIAFGRAYQLVPVSADMLIFPPEWIDGAMVDRVPEFVLTHGRRVAAFDFAYSEKRVEGNNPDWSVCIVGILFQGQLYVVDMLRIRATYPEFKRRAIEMCRRHGVAMGWAEANGPQKGIVQQFSLDAPFSVAPIMREKDKVTRAAEVQGFVEAGSLHLLGNRRKGGLEPIEKLQVLRDEMSCFPAGENDDTVDAVVDLISESRRGFVGEKVMPPRPSPLVHQRSRLTRIYRDLRRA